jgi:1,4-alpha-glucan branching enzyme
MSSDGFRWISCDDWQNSVYAYVRQGKQANDRVLVVINFTPIPRYNYRVGVPTPGYYIERMNTDSSLYGGSNLGNVGGVYSQSGACHGEGQFVSLTLPPLGMLILKPVSVNEAS